MLNAQQVILKLNIMNYDFKGIRNTNLIDDFLQFLTSANENNLWLHFGMIVEIDPTIDFTNNNVLIRWREKVEGFNDKIIYYNLAEFKNDFQLINA